MPESRGQRIKRLRQSLDLDQMDLAERAGIKSQSMISRLESDNYKRMPEEIIEKIAKALNTTSAYLNVYDSTLSFMPEHIREFVTNPENLDEIRKVYIMTEASKIKGEIKEFIDKSDSFDLLKPPHKK